MKYWIGNIKVEVVSPRLERNHYLSDFFRVKLWLHVLGSKGCLDTVIDMTRRMFRRLINTLVALLLLQTCSSKQPFRSGATGAENTARHKQIFSVSLLHIVSCAEAIAHAAVCVTCSIELVRSTTRLLTNSSLCIRCT